jgi:hypothetical protein
MAPQRQTPFGTVSSNKRVLRIGEAGQLLLSRGQSVRLIGRWKSTLAGRGVSGCALSKQDVAEYQAASGEEFQSVPLGAVKIL